MTDYLRKSFTVAAPGNDSYRDGWERTFGKGGSAGNGLPPLDLRNASTEALLEAAAKVLSVEHARAKELAAELMKLADELNGAKR